MDDDLLPHDVEASSTNRLSDRPHLQTPGSDFLVAANHSISRRRVVITGLGAITNIGNNANACWESITGSRSGIGLLTAFEQGDDWTVTIAGEIKGLDGAIEGVVDPSEAKRMDRMSVMALCAERKRHDTAGWTHPGRSCTNEAWRSVPGSVA